MPLAIICPTCKFEGEMPDNYPGTWVRCRRCREKFALAAAKVNSAAPIIAHNALPDCLDEKAANQEVLARKQRERAAKQKAKRAAEKATLTYTCPQCGSTAELPVSQAGQQTVCVWCNFTGRVP